MSAASYRLGSMRGQARSLLGVGVSLLIAGSAHADIALRHFARPRAASTALRGAETYLPVLVSVPPGQDASKLGFQRQTARFASGFVLPSEVQALQQGSPRFHFSWSAPRFPFVDEGLSWIEARSFWAETGLRGSGAVVGIVDTGLDLTHGDFRDQQGRLRVRWLIDFSKPPTGVHAALEAEFGCTGRASCAVYAEGDLEELLARQESGALPTDDFGHGTFVASIAAGSGRSETPARYVGVAPEADLVIARVARNREGAMQDPDIVTATRFVFDRAEALGKPAVVNLSLGSTFGPHDERSMLGRVLADFVGPAHPGRAIVAAAGNEAGLFIEQRKPYPPPYGTHTSVHVPPGADVLVPLLVATSDTESAKGSVLVWIGMRPGDALSIGLDQDDDRWLSQVPPGASSGDDKDDVKGRIFHDDLLGPSPTGSASEDPYRDAAVTLEGTWKGDQIYVVRLRGHGTAELWVQATADEGELDARFPRAAKEGTVSIPAAHPELIAVGATLNRVRWRDHTDQIIEIDQHGSLIDPHPDSPALFSAAGPNQAGRIKPDLVAPGGYIAAAMAAPLDPRKNGGQGMFAASGSCPEESECLVVDDHHAVAGGTSMAAPFVAGAAALLLQRDPTLTQSELRSLLQAGAGPLEGTVQTPVQVGAGRLDLLGTLRALDEREAPMGRLPHKAGTTVALAASFVTPDPGAPIEGLVKLRSASGELADGFAPQDLELKADGLVVAESLTRRAPGLWGFRVAARASQGGRIARLSLTFRGELLVEREVRVAVDLSAARFGFLTEGGCAVGPVGGFAWPPGVGAVGALLLAHSSLHRRRRGRPSVGRTRGKSRMRHFPKQSRI